MIRPARNTLLTQDLGGTIDRQTGKIEIEHTYVVRAADEHYTVIQLEFGSHTIIE